MTPGDTVWDYRLTSIDWTPLFCRIGEKIVIDSICLFIDPYVDFRCWVHHAELDLICQVHVLHVWELNNYMGNISWILWTGASAKRLQKWQSSWESDWMNHLFITFGPARNFVLLESCSLRCHIGGGRANASQNIHASIHPNSLLFSFTRSYIGSLLPVFFLVFLWNIDGQSAASS